MKNDIPDRDPPRRWLELGLLAIGILFGMTTWFSATSVLPQLVDAWSLSRNASSFVTISVQIGFVVGAIFSAVSNLADLIRARRLFFLGCIGAAVANVGLIFVHTEFIAFALRFITGVCLAAVYPPALKAMSTWFRKGRGVGLGIMIGGLTLGSATPHLLDGLEASVDWRSVILTTSGLSILGGCLVEFVATDGPFQFPSAKFKPAMSWRVISDRGVRLALLGYFGHMWELYAMWAWFGAFAAYVLREYSVHHVGEDAALLTFAAIGVGAFGCWLGGVLGDRWGRTRLTALAMLLSGLSCLAIGIVQIYSLYLTIGVGLFWGFWVIADSAQFSSIVTEIADQSYVGTALTLQLAIGFSLTVATIWLIPVLRDSLGWAWAFAFLAPGPIMGVIAMMRLQKRPEARRIAGGIG